MARIKLSLSRLPLIDEIAKTRHDAKTRTSYQNNKEDVVDQLLTQLTVFVESVAGDDLRRSSGILVPNFYA